MIVERLELEPSSLEELGLREVKMTGLGRFVALTGKNGAGKSRVLRAVLERIGLAVSRDQALMADLEPHQRRQYEDLLPEDASWRWEAERVQRFTRELSFSSPPRVFFFQATPTGFPDPSDATQKWMAGSVRALANSNTAESSECVLWAWNEYQNTLRQQSRGAKSKQTRQQVPGARHPWIETRDLIRQLLEVDFDVDPKRRGFLFNGRAWREAEEDLSGGQRVLLQLAIAIRVHSASLDNTVLFMDEPENHLHPSAVIDVLERLKNASGRMQFWIATHSVPLLAYLHAQDAKCLWYVEDGRVQHAGKLQQRVLESLLGNTERLEQLRTFVALPEQVAIEQFATECLLPPGVSDRGKGDPQVQQISGVIETLRAERKRPLEVLDYGAGRGRLLAGMFADNASDFRDRISYRALDEYPNGREDCVRVIESVYGSSEGRYFSELKKFDNDRRVPVDLLVLCNVLHEMPPEDWQRRFGAGNDFARMLADDGFLLVVEDQEIHVGEHAHKYGFLLLDTAELRALFAVEQRDIDEKRFVVTKHRKRGDRLKAHWIAASLVERVTHDTVVAALTLLKKRSRDEINRLRSQPGGDGKQNGQAHARAAMLFANASLALDARGKS